MRLPRLQLPVCIHPGFDGKTGFARRLLGVASLVSTILSAQTPLVLPPADRRAEPVPAPRSADPVGAVKGLVVPPGLTAHLWASEPMLANPTAIAFDERGRLFVAETHRFRTSALDIRDYPTIWERDLAGRTVADRVGLLESAFGRQVSQLAIESERIRMLEDTNADGVADRSLIVAEGFNSPETGVVSGVLARGNQIWVAGSPSLFRLTLEGEGAGVARREEMMRGFGVHIGLAGHDVHGFAVGPDAKLYFSMGDRGAQMAGEGGNALALPDTGAVLRSNLDGSGVEVVATGLRNPRGLAFDDFGNLFAADGDSEHGDRARLIQVMEGGEYGWRTGYQLLGAAGPWIREGLWRPGWDRQAAYLLPPIGHILSGPAGMAYFPGEGLTPEYHGRFFVSHWNTGPADSGIRTYALKPAGAGFVIDDVRDFVRGVMPTAVTFGPDRRLYFADWVSGWPWPKSGRGRIYAVAPSHASAAENTAHPQRLGAKGMAGLTLSELGGYLGHADQRVRLSAQFELAQRGAPALAVFETVATGVAAPRLARLHAVWGLGELAARLPAALNQFPTLLADKDVEVRAQTARMLGDHLRIEALRALRTALQDPEPRVALFAAQSLGKLRQNDAIPALLALLRRNDDRDLSLRHAVVVALARLGADPALEVAVKDPSRAVRMGSLLAYRRLGHGAVAFYLDDSDPEVVREAARAINDVPILGGLPALAALLDSAPLDDEALVRRVLNAHFRLGQAENAAALTAFAGRSYVPASFRAEALRHLAMWAKPPSRDGITGQPWSVAARDPEPAKKALVGFLSNLAGKTPVEVQVATMDAVADLGVAGTGHALWDVVYQPTHPMASRVAALQALEKKDDLRLEVAAVHSARSEHPELRLAALPILARRPPEVSVPILAIIARNGTAAELKLTYSILAGIDDPRAEEILAAALRRLAAGDLPAGAQAELLDATRRRESPEVVEAVRQLQAGWSASTDRLAPFRSALEGGNASEGGRLYVRDSRLACGQCHEVGPGPSLADIGATRSKESLLEAVALRHANVPGNAGQVLSRRELRDLIAYLAGLRGPLADGAATALPR